MLLRDVSRTYDISWISIARGEKCRPNETRSSFISRSQNSGVLFSTWLTLSWHSWTEDAGLLVPLVIIVFEENPTVRGSFMKLWPCSVDVETAYFIFNTRRSRESFLLEVEEASREIDEVWSWFAAIKVVRDKRWRFRSVKKQWRTVWNANSFATITEGINPCHGLRNLLAL